MLKKLRHIVIVLCCMGICLGSCGKDDDDSFVPEPEVQTGASVQVMVVFAPGQLSNKGYGERLLTGAYQLRDSVATRDSLDVDFISSLDIETTDRDLEEWALDTINNIYANPYERRLLVLAEPYLVTLLGDIKDALRPTDEVLVLKTTDEDLRTANDTLGLGDRLHAMSISAAKTTRNWLKCREYTMSLADIMDVTYDGNITLLRIYDDTQYHYCDSIYETLIEEGIPKEKINKIHLISNPKVFYSFMASTNANLTELVFFYTQLLEMDYNENGLRKIAIVDFEAGNAAFNYYQMSTKGNMAIFSTIVNSDNYIGINCLYDVALKSWATRWLHQPSRTMPAMEWHGNWDGCCPDDIFTFFVKDE